jgi:hypothetical protein
MIDKPFLTYEPNYALFLFKTQAQSCGFLALFYGLVRV